MICQHDLMMINYVTIIHDLSASPNDDSATTGINKSKLTITKTKKIKKNKNKKTKKRFW